MENLGYAFTWLTNSKEETKMLGAIQLEKFVGLTSMPQKAASAWASIEKLVGANYTPIAYVGTQVVKGVNHWFIVGVETVTAQPVRRIVTMAVNEFNGEYKLVTGSDVTIFG